MEHLKDQLAAYSPDQLVAFASALAGVAVFALARQFLSGLAVPERLTASQDPPATRSRPPSTCGASSHQAAGAAGRSWNSSRLPATISG